LTAILDGSKAVTEVFDKVLVATGSFSTPHLPKIDSIEKFQGSVLHSINYQQPSEYKGQNVLLVGLHASSVDTIVDLADHANRVYASHRSGVCLVCVFTRLGFDVP
jgi:dimethylaniline monooxygenase (N-oxide forming)